MKKMMITLTLAVAALSAFSCSKVNTDASPVKGTPITIEVAAPEFDGEAPDALGTKVSFNGSPLKHKFDAGDYFRIYSYLADGSVLTDWGRFTTDAGGTYARFHGEMPENYTAATHGGVFRVFYHQGIMEEVTWNSGSNRYECKYNIPAEQDGTGLKYCLFSNSNDPTFDTENLILTLQFRCYNGLCHINVVGGDVRTIRVTVNHAKNANYYVVSKGTNKDIVFNCTNRALSGGGGKVVTINRNNEVLSGDVYFAIRQTSGNATQGYASLVFEFINGAGEVCTKHLTLAESVNTDGTAGTYYNVSSYFSLSNFGTVDLTNATFVAP